MFLDFSEALLTITTPLIRFRRSSEGGQHGAPEAAQKPIRKKGQNEERRRRDDGGLRRIADRNGLIGAPPEITCDDFDDEHDGGTVARVRFEEERPR